MVNTDDVDNAAAAAVGDGDNDDDDYDDHDDDYVADDKGKHISHSKRR